jgi:site-specific recombinase XerD
LEFFTAKTRNHNTRSAYARAVGQFCAWCEAQGIRFEQLQPMIVAAYIEGHSAAAPTVKQHLAAIRMLCDYLVVTGVLRMNPAAAVRGPARTARTARIAARHRS